MAVLTSTLGVLLITSYCSKKFPQTQTNLLTSLVKTPFIFVTDCLTSALLLWLHCPGLLPLLVPATWQEKKEMSQLIDVGVHGLSLHPSSSQVCLQQVLGTLFQLKGSQANNFTTVEQILLYVQVH